MVTLLLIISHLIGDFVLQSAKISTEKQQYFSKLVKYCLLYTFVVAAVLLMSIDFRSSIIPIVIIAIVHFAIDYARVLLDKKASARVQVFSYFIDQILHFGVIFIIAYSFNLEIHIGSFLQSAMNAFGKEDINNCIIYVLIYLVMLQPAAVTVKKMLAYISSQEHKDKDAETVAPYNAGYLIGILERIIVAALVLENQLSAIGFVLAAKSLARFNQLNDKEFAEKYLVGSLTSIAISIVITLILKSMLL